MNISPSDIIERYAGVTIDRAFHIMTQNEMLGFDDVIAKSVPEHLLPMVETVFKLEALIDQNAEGIEGGTPNTEDEEPWPEDSYDEFIISCSRCVTYASEYTFLHKKMWELFRKEISIPKEAEVYLLLDDGKYVVAWPSK